MSSAERGISAQSVPFRPRPRRWRTGVHDMIVKALRRVVRELVLHV